MNRSAGTGKTIYWLFRECSTTKRFETFVTDKKEIQGLPATALGLAAKMSKFSIFVVESISFILSSPACLVVFCFTNFVSICNYSCMKMQLLRMGCGELYWILLSYTSLMQHLLETEDCVRKSIELMLLVPSVVIWTIHQSSTKYWSLGWKRLSFSVTKTILRYESFQC